MDGFIQKYSAKLQQRAVPGQNGQCLIWIGALTPNGKYGVINCKFPNAIGWKQIHAHRLAYMIRHRIAQFPDADVSHLCHNTKCMNVDHLVLEPHGINNSRRSCVSCGRCLGHPDNLPPCRLDLKMPHNDIGKFYNNLIVGVGGAFGNVFFISLFIIFVFN